MALSEAGRRVVRLVMGILCVIFALIGAALLATGVGLPTDEASWCYIQAGEYSSLSGQISFGPFVTCFDVWGLGGFEYVGGCEVGDTAVLTGAPSTTGYGKAAVGMAILAILGATVSFCLHLFGFCCCYGRRGTSLVIGSVGLAFDILASVGGWGRDPGGGFPGHER